MIRMGKSQFSRSKKKRRVKDWLDHKGEKTVPDLDQDMKQRRKEGSAKRGREGKFWKGKITQLVIQKRGDRKNDRLPKKVRGGEERNQKTEREIKIVGKGIKSRTSRRG